MTVSLLSKVTPTSPAVPSALLPSDAAKDAELLVLRYDNTALRRHMAHPVCQEPADQFWVAAPSELIPRRRWASRTPDHSIHCPNRSPIQTRSHTSKSTDVTARAASCTSMNTPHDLHGRGFRHPQRWVGTVRRECTDRVLLVGERHLATVLAKYTRHYNGHRPHRSLGQQPPTPPSEIADLTAARVHRRRILGDVINEYAQAA